jgi:hypothetical protein
VWTDPANNTTYVVNGHNRLARANQLGIPTLPTRELPAATAEEARALGALANIKEGRGTVFDAAKFMRDTGITSPEQLQRMGAPMTDGHAARGLALSQLPDNIFQAAVDGRLSVGKAAAIGGSGLDETQMQRAYKALSSGKDMSDAKFSEIVQQVRSAPVVEGSQVDLFGNTEAMSLMGQKADLVTAIRGDLLKEKRVFGTAARGAGRLEQGGNVINVENSRAIAADAGQVLGMFDRLKYAPGPVGELLNDGARQIAEGAKPKVIADRIRGQVAEAVRSAMDEQGLPTARPTAAAAEAAEAAPQAVELTPEQRQAAQIEVIRRAVDEAEVRPPETPIPELPDGPALTPDLARADLETRGGQVEPGTPAAQAMADEIRLTAEFAERDAQMRAIAEEGAKDAMGYELKTFEERKALGMTDGFDKPPEPEARPLAEGEVAPAPVRPEPLQLADTPAPAPKIDIPARASTKLSASRADSVAASLYDWGNTGYPEGRGPIKSIEEAKSLAVKKGRNLYAERVPGLDLDKAINDRAMGRNTPEVEAVAAAYRQFYGVPEPEAQMPRPRTKTADQATRQQIQANEQRMAELRRKMQDEGCSL